MKIMIIILMMMMTTTTRGVTGDEKTLDKSVNVVGSGSKGVCLRCSVSVSYTHLDVYKRQEYDGPDNPDSLNFTLEQELEIQLKREKETRV